MSLFLSILGADLKDRFTRVSTYIYFSVFFVLSFLLALSAAGLFENVQINFGGSTRVLVNAPFSVQMTFLVISIIAVFVIAPIFGQNAFKDYLFGFDEIVNSRSYSRTAYFFARYLSAFLVSLFILSSLGFGFGLGVQYPSIDPAYLGDFGVFTYIYPYIFGIIPNLLILGGVFYFMGAFFKKMAYVYLSGAAVFMGWMLSGQLGRDVESYMLAALVDPSGIKAVSILTKYWTAAQQNELYVPLESYFLYNRLLWGAVGVLSLVFARVHFERKPSKSSSKVKNQKAAAGEVLNSSYKNLSFPSTRAYSLKTFLGLVKHEFMQSIKHPVVLTLLFLGFGYMLILSPQIGKMFGAPTLPVTYKVIEMLGGVFSLFVLIIITFWTGEMIWKEQTNHMDEIVDSSPASIVMLRLPKLVAMNMLVAVLMLTVIATGVLVQTFKGYTNYEFSVYFKTLFLGSFLTYFVLSCLAFAAHALSGNKFIGHGVMILYYIYYQFGSALGIERGVFQLGYTPPLKYSQMNGFGPNVYGHTVFSALWMALGVALVVLSLVLIQRGKESFFKKRLNSAKSVFSQPLKATFALSFLSFVGLWVFTYYNTSVLNEYLSVKTTTAKQVDYEKTYKEKWLYAPRPNLISAKLTFDLFPKERRAVSKIEAQIKNVYTSPIEEALVSVASKFNAKLTVEGGYEVIKQDRDLLHIKFKTPLMPNEVRDLTYNLEILNKGFENSEEDWQIVKNGSFISSSYLAPTFGYNSGFEVSERKKRRKYGLGELQRVLDPKKAISSKYTYLAQDALKIDFEATVSTSADQTIVTPGYLVKSWTEGGRKYATYKMDEPILKFFSVLSARYEVKKDKWNDVDLEVFYTKGHEANTGSMISSAKDSLDYFTKNFSPYQYKQFRVFEFPRYAGFAQAFPNTIPFSESLGFIADFSKKEDIDYVYYVTSHEFAHQWFGHQLAGGLVPGATMLVESLAQYGALMVMKNYKTDHDMKKYLKYEANKYLSGRANEKIKEKPLAMNENQGYIHYQKASLVFYRLQEEIGEDLVNSVLSQFIKDHGLNANKEPLPTAAMLVEQIKKAAPAKVALIDELFNQIVLYENRALKAEKTKLKNGDYEVTLSLDLKKIKADEDGKEEFVDFKEEVPVGVRDKEGKLIYYKRHLLSQGEHTLKIKVKEEPFKAGVDPINSFIDKSLKDNEVSI